MFDSTSRYYNLESARLTAVAADGTVGQVIYKRRRFIPDVSGTVTLVEHIVTGGERLDLITTRYLGDPLHFWRLCDVNRVLRPTELTDEPGTIIRIALPGF